MYLLNTFKLQESETNRAKVKRTLIGTGLGASTLGVIAKATENKYKKNKKSIYDKLVKNDLVNKENLDLAAKEVKNNIHKARLKNVLNLQLLAKYGKIPETVASTTQIRRSLGNDLKQQLAEVRTKQANRRLLHYLGAGALLGTGAGILYNKLRKARKDKGSKRNKYNRK